MGRQLTPAASVTKIAAIARRFMWDTKLIPGHGLFDLEHCQKRFLWYLHRPHLLHAFLSLALLLEQLALAGHVPAVALRRDILAERANRFTGDHLRADRGLNHDLEQLARNQVFQFLRDLATPL